VETVINLLTLFVYALLSWKFSHYPKSGLQRGIASIFIAYTVTLALSFYFINIVVDREIISITTKSVMGIVGALFYLYIKLKYEN